MKSAAFDTPQRLGTSMTRRLVREGWSIILNSTSISAFTTGNSTSIYIPQISPQLTQLPLLMLQLYIAVVSDAAEAAVVCDGPDAAAICDIKLSHMVLLL